MTKVTGLVFLVTLFFGARTALGSGSTCKNQLAGSTNLSESWSSWSGCKGGSRIRQRIRYVDEVEERPIWTTREWTHWASSGFNNQEIRRRLKPVIESDTRPCSNDIISCPSGTTKINGHCIYIERGLLQYPAAKSNCEKKGGILYEPRDKVTNFAVAKYVKVFLPTNPFIWLGFHNANLDQNFVYASNGELFRLSSEWDKGQPDRREFAFGGYHNLIVTNGRLHDLPYTNSLPRPSVCDITPFA